MDLQISNQFDGAFKLYSASLKKKYSVGNLDSISGGWEP